MFNHVNFVIFNLLMLCLPSFFRLYVCTLETSALTKLKFDRDVTNIFDKDVTNLQEEYSDELETHINPLDNIYKSRKVKVKWKSTSI